MNPTSASLLQPGRTVWKKARAEHVAVLVDGANYFSAVARAMTTAQHSIFIVGWDIDTRLPLGKDLVGFPEELSAFLDTLVRSRPLLHVRILTWDYSPVYLLEREVLPALKFGAKTHQRVRFELDGNHPPFAAHHQKIVVIDDAIAFSGGLDLTDHRWDTPEHHYRDPRRATLDGELYTPFHDVQCAVDGAAARALGELARERWRRVTHEEVPMLTATSLETPRWPEQIDADFTAVDVGISRTDAAHEDRPLVHEVEQLYLDAIGAAKERIYLETQYLTAETLIEALERRLSDDDAPEIVIVGPVSGDGWIESQTIGAMHSQSLIRLRRADRHRRLRLVFAMVPDDTGKQSRAIFIHAKILVVDDRLFRVGSANLTNRSFGVDSECDLSIEAAPEDLRTQAAIARARARLVAEHLGMSVEDVVEATRTHGLCTLIDGRKDHLRTLLEVSARPEAAEKPKTDTPEPVVMAFADPPKPFSPDMLLDTVAPAELGQRARFPYVRLAAIVALIAGLALVWRMTPLAQTTELDALLTTAAQWKTSALAPLWWLLGFAVLSQVWVPLNLLIVATVLLFGPLLGPPLALIGACTAASLGYATGSLLGGDLIERLAGPRVTAMRRKLARTHVLPVLLLRILPVAPAQVISLVAGAWRLRFRAFFLGTLLGTLPGLLILSVLGDRLAALFYHPNAQTASLFIGVAFLIALLMLWMRSFLRRRTGQRILT